MGEFFSKLFDTSDFMARWQCGVWTPTHGWLHILSDLAIWGAYTTIPLIILYYLSKKPDIPFPRVGWCFAAFIFFCGTGHLIEASIFWWPNYRLDGLVKVCTAIASWATVAAVAPLMPRALELPGLNALVERLENEVAERQRAEHALQQRNDDLQTLLHIISHDLREPLRGIRGLASLLGTRYNDQLDDAGRDILHRIDTSGERLDVLIRDLNQFTRAQNLSVRREPVNLADAVASALERLSARIEATRASITVAPDLPQIIGDRNWVTQAIYNLLSNALKFSTKGARPQIEILGHVSESSPDRIGVVVRDRGIGVNPERREAIFELFRRDAEPSIEGTGTGLAIVKAIATRHGGDAWVAARNGGGSEFYLVFSNASPAAAERES